MHEPIRQRCIQLANLLIETNKTVRALAEQTGYSKSTIHKDLTERLPNFSEQLAFQVKEILEQHKATRHLRGGEATRMKWAKLKDEDSLALDTEQLTPSTLDTQGEGQLPPLEQPNVSLQEDTPEQTHTEKQSTEPIRL